MDENTCYNMNLTNKEILKPSRSSVLSFDCFYVRTNPKIVREHLLNEIIQE